MAFCTVHPNRRVYIRSLLFAASAIVDSKVVEFLPWRPTCLRKIAPHKKRGLALRFQGLKPAVIDPTLANIR